MFNRASIIPGRSCLFDEGELYRSTRYRFVVNEQDELAQRHVMFNLSELIDKAILATGSRRCTSVVKGTDGSYNRIILMNMDDRQDVIVKIPTQKAGFPYYTTASEVATMEFARSVLGLPVPKVFAWNCNAASNPVGAEYIIMEKASGVPLSTLWDVMSIQDRGKLIQNFLSVQEKMAGVGFDSYGSLYFVEDLDKASKADSNYEKSSQSTVLNGRFVVGPTVGRNWLDDGRALMNFPRGPWQSLHDYKTAVGLREMACVEQMPSLPVSWMFLYGRGTYQRSRQMKILALHRYLELLQYLLPLDDDLNRATLWHADTHSENIFVDPENPSQITAIIDWQSTEIAPLFEFARQPGFLNHEGPPAEGLERPRKPANFEELGPDAKGSARKLWIDQTLEVYYRKLVQQSSKSLDKAREFCDTSAENLLLLARHLLIDGEAHYLWCIKELRAEWESLPAVQAAGGHPQFPYTYTPEDVEKIERNIEDTQRAMLAMTELKRQLGQDFPDRGAVLPDQHDRIVRRLGELKQQFTAKYGDLDWPFDEE